MTKIHFVAGDPHYHTVDDDKPIVDGGDGDGYDGHGHHDHERHYLPTYFHDWFT